MKPVEALDVATQVAEALAVAHQAGIVHRDIKPENLMLRADGYVKVLDFGLAKLTEANTQEIADENAPTKLRIDTRTGVVMGTAYYMSPEQARGLKVDGRTDTWSLGVVLYEMVTGCAPFTGETKSDLIVSILEKEPPPLARYSLEAPQLQRIITKRLQEREERYKTIKDLALDLPTQEELEFEAKLERSQSAHTSGTGRVARTDAETLIDSAAGTAEHSRPLATVSATSGIKRFTNALTHRRKVAAALGLLLFGGLSYFILTSAGRLFTGRNKAINSIAILPLVNVSNDPNTEYLSDGITESLINSLSQLPNLKVMSRNSVFRYKGREWDAQEVAHQLGVRAVVTGRVVQQSDALAISVELVDAEDNSHIWGSNTSASSPTSSPCRKRSRRNL